MSTPNPGGIRNDPGQYPGRPAQGTGFFLNPDDPYAPFSQTGGSGNRPSQPAGQGTAIASLIFAFLFAPLGIVLGHVSRAHARRAGQHPPGMATAGLVIGYVIVGFYLMVVIGSHIH